MAANEPEWAAGLRRALELIDQHDHPLTVSGVNHSTGVVTIEWDKERSMSKVKPGDKVVVLTRETPAGSAYKRVIIDWALSPEEKATRMYAGRYPLTTMEVTVVALSSMAGSRGVLVETPGVVEGLRLDARWGDSDYDFGPTKPPPHTRVWYTPEYELVSASAVVATRSHDPGGCSCDQCREFYPYAEPNQPDGTLKCYQCRQDPYRGRF